MAKIFRIDRAFIRPDKIIKKQSKSDQITGSESGFIRLPITTTRAGIFLYRDLEGNIIRELRHPDEVFKAESLNTIKGIPFTNDHPPGMVFPDNWQQYTVGSIGDQITVRDKEFVDSSLTIYDKKIIELIISGKKQEVSSGYWAESVFEAGVWEGQEYDSIQKNIVYNHVSLVDIGRAGPDVKIHLDGSEIPVYYEVLKDIKDNSSFKKEKKIIMFFGMRDIKIDEKDQDYVKSYLDEKNSEVKKVEDSRAELQKLFDQKDGELAQLKKELDDLKKIDHAAEARVKIDFENKVRPVLGADYKFDSKSILDIQKDVLAKINPELDLSGKTDGFIEGYFNAEFNNYQKKYDQAEDSFKKLSTAIAGAPPKNDKDELELRADSLFDKLAGKANK